MNPVHLSVDKTNRWIYVANLQTGTVAVIPRHEDGSVRDVKTLYTIEGKEPDTWSHPHQVMQDRIGDYLLVSCQGRKAGFGQVDVLESIMRQENWKRPVWSDQEKLRSQDTLHFMRIIAGVTE